MKTLRFLALLAVPSILAASAACGDPDCSVTKTCNVGNTTASSGGASTSTTSSAQGGAGGTGTGGTGGMTGTGGSGGDGTNPGNTVWQLALGDGSNQRVNDVDIDDENNIYVVGEFEGQLMLGQTTLSSVGAKDAFVAKLASTGALIWARQFGDASTQTADRIEVGAGVLVIAGEYWGTPSFDGDTLPNSDSRGWYAAQLSTSTGAAVWATGVTSSPQNAETKLVLDVALRANGSAFVVESRQSNQDAGIYLRTVTSTGLSDELKIGASRLTRTTNGDVIAAGGFSNSLSVAGGNTLVSNGGSDVWVARLDASLNHVWSASFGGPGNDGVAALAEAPDGTILVAGRSDGDFIVGSGQAVNQGMFDAYVARLASNGAPQNVVSVGGSDFEVFNAVAQAGGTVIAAGYSRGTFAVGNDTLTGKGGRDAIVLAFNAATLAPTWARRGGDLDDQEALGVGVDVFGRATVGGYFRESLNLGPILASTGNEDAFLVQFSP